jgi:hypothetical protein
MTRPTLAPGVKCPRPLGGCHSSAVKLKLAERTRSAIHAKALADAAARGSGPPTHGCLSAARCDYSFEMRRVIGADYVANLTLDFAGYRVRQHTAFVCSRRCRTASPPRQHHHAGLHRGGPAPCGNGVKPRLPCRYCAPLFGLAEVVGDLATYNRGAWSSPDPVFASATTGTDAVSGVSCATEKFCMAVAYAGGVSIYSGGRWSAVLSSMNGAQAVSCPSASYCLVEIAPEGGLEAWASGSWVAYSTLNSSLGQSANPVSCMPGSSSFCMYVDNSDGYTLGTSGPVATIPGAMVSVGSLATASCWDRPRLEGTLSGGIVVVGYSPACMVGDANGDAFLYQGGKWDKFGDIDSASGNPDIVAVSCTFTFCAAVDFNDHILWFTGSWSKRHAMGAGGAPADISCSSEHFCMDVNDNGKAAIIDPTA